ncbi:MAG: NADH-quinone oxidoreductase subunit L, partial [Deltaproteobacteria bacterium]
GVYMIGRMNFLYTLAPDALTVVMWVGALTAIFAATIGLAQNDIKKVLAYSTVSQLGYMFLAMGVGAYAVGIFHLMTHAFFKACLFLGSGSVIHAMSGEQDMRRMGGLKAYLPITYWTFLIASVAIAGIFPFAGFFSKDEILWRSYSGHHYGPWILGLVAAVCTAFYMFRLISLTFYGSCRADEKVKHHIHESPWTMTVPLIVLAFLSVVGGFVGIPHALTVAAEKIGIHGADGATNLFGQWLAPVFAAAHHAAPHGAEAAHASLATEYLLMVVSVALALVSIAAALFVYLRRPDLPATIARRFRLAYDLVYHKYYVDEIYEATVIRFTMNLMRFLGRFDLVVIDGIVNGCAALVRVVSRIGGWLDLRFVDGLVNLVADLAMAVGRRLRLIQTGSVQIYLYTVLGGMVAILIIGIASGSI